MLTTLLLILVLSAPPHDPVAAALQSFADVRSYRVTLRSRHDDAKETIRYFYRKPGLVRMDFLRPHAGAILVYDPATGRVRVRPPGPFRGMVLSFSPDNRLVKSSGGHRVDESDLGSLLRRVRSLQGHGATVVLGRERLGNRRATEVEVTGRDGFRVGGVHRYRLWLDAATHLPLKASAYDGTGRLMEEVLMDDLEVNVPLGDTLFEP